MGKKTIYRFEINTNDQFFWGLSILGMITGMILMVFGGSYGNLGLSLVGFFISLYYSVLMFNIIKEEES